MSAELSRMGFRLAFVLSTGAMTLHDLIHTLAFEGVPFESRTSLLRDGVSELCRSRLIQWVFEPDYGNAPSIKPETLDERSFDRIWQSHLNTTDFSVETPNRNNPTLFVEATPTLMTEIEKPEYCQWRDEINW
jgi:hypothetical protein